MPLVVLEPLLSPFKLVDELPDPLSVEEVPELVDIPDVPVGLELREPDLVPLVEPVECVPNDDGEGT